MKINCIKVGYLECNCYILEKDNQVIVIDPGDEYFKIKPYLEEKEVLAILITHRHFDHVGALNKVLEDYPVKVYEYNNLEEKEYILGNFKFKVMFTLGHTLDSISFYFYEDNTMFTGDFLFEGTIGRTDFKESDVSLMKKSLIKIKEYSLDLDIYPGHGAKTTLNREKKYNPYLQEDINI